MSICLFLAYLTAIELSRLTIVSGSVALFAPAAAALVAMLIYVPRDQRTRWVALATVAGVGLELIRGVRLPGAVTVAAANLAVALIAHQVLRRTIAERPIIRSVQDATRVLVAYACGSLAGAGVTAISLTLQSPDAVSAQVLHLQFLSTMTGLFAFATPFLVGWANLRNAVRGRAAELTGLLIATGVMTHVFWAATDVPRPGLLAPLFVWAAFRFQLAGSVIDLPFTALALADSMMDRGPWAESGGIPETIVGLWLHLLVTSTFLVVSAGVFERRRDQLLLRRVFDEVSDGIIVIGEDGVVETLNRGAALQFLVDRGSAGPLTAGELLGDAWRQRDPVSGRLADVEVTLQRRSGEAFPARVSLTPVASDDEQHVLAVIHDLSRQRQTEESLQNSEAQWQAVLEALPDAILIHDPEGRYTGVHTPAAGPLRQPAERFIGHTVWDILPHDEAAVVDGMRERVRTSRRAETLEFEGTLDGRQRWFHSHMVPLGSDRTLSIVRDVTDQRSLQDQLRQAQRLEAIGRLAGGVAHDFNNLLTVIGGSTDLVLEQLPEWDPNRRTLEEVRLASDRAAALTQQLLAFGRRQMLQSEVFDLPDVVVACEQMLRRLIGEHIRLVCRVNAVVPPVRADRSQIEQVIVNLAVNARDAMPTGGDLFIETGSVMIAADDAHANPDVVPGHFVTLAVRDTGIGIPDDVVEHIFEPFFTTKGIGQGTGLGLATVYGIARQSGGFITVSSEVDRGTTFTLHLPAVSAPARANTVPPVAAAITRGCETVLLVEDEDGVRGIASRFLTSAGYQVMSAASGAEAMALAASLDRPVDLLVTDVVMPGMSGPQLAEQLRQQMPGVRVVFMSGYPNDALLVHDLPAQQAVFLHKPFSRQALTDTLRDALESDAAVD